MTDTDISVGQVVTDTFTGLLLTVTETTQTDDGRDAYLRGEFVRRDDVGTQTRHYDDVDPT